MATANEKERGRLREKAALGAYGALLARCKNEDLEDLSVIADIAYDAWQYADLFLEAKRDIETVKYDVVLYSYKGAEALRRIIELDNPTSKRMIDHLTAFYGSIEAYEKAEYPHRTIGQKAIAEFLKQQRGTRHRVRQ